MSSEEIILMNILLESRHIVTGFFLLILCLITHLNGKFV